MKILPFRMLEYLIPRSSDIENDSQMDSMQGSSMLVFMTAEMTVSGSGKSLMLRTRFGRVT